MKNTYTSLETIRTRNGKTILFKQEDVAKWFKTNYEQNYLNLSQEEKNLAFQLDTEYGDLLIKLWKEPLQNLISESGANWALPDGDRNPIEEYYYQLAGGNTDEDLTDEQYQLKLERLRLQKEWFEKNR